MDIGDQSDMNPNQSFRAEPRSQFQPPYSYPQSNASFTIDQDMSLTADNFAATVQAHTASPLDSGSGNSGPAQGTTTVNASGTSVAAPGMAPPQTASQPYSPSGARASLDDGPDGGLSGGDPKRKRSKVSRACDECRRKKVRCDAAADDGTIKTCSNCARAGLTCEYSRIPMKRGPSKGYIKELSERVQQVESLQMALSNTSGYRQSLDASGGVYAEQPYSPDDPMSLKRNFSFSDQRSPFVGPDYNRERMPSVGGWNSSSPHSSMFRARERGSIALAPDQQPATPVSFAKPFWAQDLEEAPPAKRLKIESGDIPKPSLGQEFLSTYYRSYHTHLPILPDADATISIIERASPRLQHAFVATVRHLTTPHGRSQNGHPPGDETSRSSLEMFGSHQDLQEYLWNAARKAPMSRTAEDNLLLLWAYLLMAVEAENDLTRLHDGALPKTILIKQAVDLGWSCVTWSSTNEPIEPNPHATHEYAADFARAWHCATVLARLHALAVGSGNPIPRYHHQYFQKRVPHIADVLPPMGVIVALSASQLTVISSVVQDNLPQNQWGRNIDMHHRMTIQEQFDQLIVPRAQTAANETLVEQLKLFIDLALSRYTVNFHPMDILIPAAGLAEALRKHMAASETHFMYNPFHLHFFTLASITLLEFLSENADTEMYRVANAGIDDIKVALEQISERDHIEDEQHDTADGKIDARVEHKRTHWADVLLRMIDERVKNVASSTANDQNVANSGGSRVGDGMNAAVDFSLLLRHGYLTVLAQQVN